MWEGLSHRTLDKAMKTSHALIAAPLLFALGTYTGHQFFPDEANQKTGDEPSLSSRSERKVIRVQRPTDNDVNVSPTDLAGLLKLVDAQDYFGTSTKLRAALGDLGPGALENLILELNEGNKSDPGFHTLRTSLLNHLIAKDPFHALDMILAQDDAQFRSSSIHSIMQAAARLDLDAAREAISLIKDPQLGQSARMAVVTTSSDSDPDSLVKLLEENAAASTTPLHYAHSWVGGYGNMHFGGHYGGFYPTYTANAGGALMKLAQKDLAAAEKYANGLKTPHARMGALAQIASGLAQKDPAEALAWANQIEEGPARDQNVASIINVIAQKDPAEASALIDQIGNVQYRNGAISSLAMTWSQQDPHAAIAWLDGMPSSKARMDAYSSVAYQLSQTDPLAAVQLMDKVPGNSSRNVLPNIINQWVVKDFDGACNYVTGLDDPNKLNSALPQIISPWVQRDPMAAADFLQKAVSLSSVDTLGTHFSTIGSQWANVDRDQALNWANGLEDKKLANLARSGVYQQWAQQDPSGAAQHLSSIQAAGERSQLLHNIASSWTNQDPEAAKAWLSTLPAADRYQAASSSISTLSYSQPQLAAELYQQMHSEAGDNENHLQSINHQAGNIANYWSQYAPKDAAEWASSITSETEQGNAYRNIATNWVQYDPKGTAEWIDNLPVGLPRDRATESLVQNVQRIDPEAAFDWAASIDNPDSRYNNARSVLNQWKQKDPEAARAAITNIDVTDQQREQLTNMLK